MADLVAKSELQKYGITADDLLNKFKIQLLKDFEMSNVDTYLQPIDDFAYEAIHINLSRALKKIIDSGFSNYQQLLYRIDISEKQFDDAVRNQKNVDSNDVLADLIIKRILQKVIFKIVYSK